MGGDFVVLTENLWDELDEFRKNSASIECSTVEDVELVRYWRTSKAVDIKKINIIGTTYLLMSSLSLDEFCNWIYNERRIWNKDLLEKDSAIEIKDPSALVNKGITIFLHYYDSLQEGNQVYIFPQQKS